MTAKEITHIMVIETIQTNVTEITGVTALKVGPKIIDQEKNSINLEMK